jgi:miniconductance mechanosensitive channel
LQIYCFTRTTVWGEYEAIQADVFDHILAVARQFDLRVFQHPSGADVAALVPALGQA